jgi:hypothetical protein
VGGYVKSSYKTDENNETYLEDEWMPFAYKFSALEVIMMDVNHSAFDDKNLLRWREVILRKAGFEARQLLAEAFIFLEKHKYGFKLFLV